MDLTQLMKILNSPAGQAGISAVGAGISAAGDRADKEDARAQNAYQFAAQQLQGMQEAEDANARTVLSQSPIGESQEFAQRNALMSAILPGLRNQRSTPGDAEVAAAMGSRTGGLRLPEGGLDPAMIQRVFGDASTADSIARRDTDRLNVNPYAQTTNLSNLFGQNEGIDKVASGVSQYQQDAIGERRSAADKVRAALEKDITFQNQPKQEKKGGGFWGGLGKVLGFAAPIAAMAIPGLGPVASAIIGSAGAGAGAAMQGKNPLAAAAAGGAAGYLSKGGPQRQAPGQVYNQRQPISGFTDPNLARKVRF